MNDRSRCFGHAWRSTAFSDATCFALALCRTWIAQVEDGMGIPHLFQADIKKFSTCPIPPDVEQRRIADFLDDQVARIDNIIAARAAQLSA